MTVPVGLTPPDTVALSAIEAPTIADAGCCEVEIDGDAAPTTTGSSPFPELTDLLFESPLYVATQ